MQKHNAFAHLFKKRVKFTQEYNNRSVYEYVDEESEDLTLIIHKEEYQD